MVLPAALVFGAPVSPGTYEKGLFCESVALVERVVALADRGANPLRVVADINARLAHTRLHLCLEAGRARPHRAVRKATSPPTTPPIRSIRCR